MTPPEPPSRYGRSWGVLRQQWAQLLPQPCPRCGLPVEAGTLWDLDHLVRGDDTSARPAHRACNRSHGGTQGAITRSRLLAAGRAAEGDHPHDPADTHWNIPVTAQGMARFWAGPVPAGTPVLAPTPLQTAPEATESPGPTDSTWDACAWLGDLRAVPEEGTWPRFMTGPHPGAVGSYGAEFAAWSRQRSGRGLRWWQRLLAARLLEHDEAGRLVWLWVLLSTSRQVGKSVLLGELALWRLHQAGRWGEPQLVLMTSRDLPAAREVHRSARAWARGQAGWSVREANGQEEVADPGGSRWAVRGSGSVYSYSVSLALVDECWGVAPGVVADGIEPTLVERASPQLLLVSTAHRATTALFPRRRAVALAQLGAPVDTLLVEWSAPEGCGLDDRGGWRAASPHWTAQRERLVSSKLAEAVTGRAGADPLELDPVASFRSQWLNRWPQVGAPAAVGRDEPLLVDSTSWAGLVDLSVGALTARSVVAVEDFFGRGAAVAVAGSDGDGRVAVWGRLFPSRSEAFGYAAEVAQARPGSRLLVGASLEADPQVPADVVASVASAGTSTTRTALPLLRELVGQDRLAHDGGQDLAEQVGALRVTAGAGGLNVSARSGRSDLARAAAWAAAAVLQEVGVPVLEFFVY